MRRFIVIVLVFAAFSGTAAAKERTAGCVGFPRAYLRIENAIRIGAPVWNQGNQLLTYAIYRDTTRGILKELVPDDSCGQLHKALADALARAEKEHTPGSAGWDLRHGFDAFMEYVAKGDSPKYFTPRPVERAVAPYYDRDCPDIFQLVLRAERALAEGKGDDEARRMAAELKEKNACPKVMEALSAGIKKKEGAVALDRLAAGQPPPGELDEPAPILRRCTNAPALVEQITFGVVRGTPRLQEGHPDTALAVFRKAAEEAVTRFGEHGRCPEATSLLKKGLAEAKRESGDVVKAATALRQSFDSVAEAFVRAVPQ
jgi:hypothetical protein